MREKVIKSILSKKLRDWLESIEDEEVKKLVKKNTIITGGSIVSLISNEKPKDFDVYFRNKETVLAVANYYSNIFNEKKKDENIKVNVVDADTYKGYENSIDEETGECKKHRTVSNLEPGRVKLFITKDKHIGPGYAAENEEDLANNNEDIMETYSKADEIDSEEMEKTDSKEEKKKYRPVFFSPNAITLSDKIQIVIRFYGEPEEIHKNYDYVHCKGYWTSWDNEINISKEVYEVIINKTLVYSGSKYPLCSLFRMRKFMERGWRINAGQILKIAFQVSELDLSDLNVLEDQLIGVDSAYFSQLIYQLQKQQEENSEFKFTSGYLVSIIDKIF